MKELTTEEVARFHGVSRVRVVQWIDSGYIRATLRRGAYYVNKEEAEAFVPRKPGRPTKNNDIL
jgi:excisionase family DNA binding protein